VLVGLALPVACVLLLEGVCRIVSPIFLRNPDPELIEVNGPGYRRLRRGLPVTSNVAGTEVSFTINSHGFRDREVPAERECLVLGVGNSFVANWGLHPDEFWTAALEARLAEGAVWPRCAVRAAGFQGWSMPEVYAATLDTWDAFRPDVVVLLFNSATMWTDKPIDVAALEEARRQWYAEPHPTEVGPTPTEPSLMGRLIGLYNRLEMHMALLGTVKRLWPMLTITAGFSQLASPACYETARLEALERPTIESIRQLDALVRARGARLVVAHVPDLPEVDDDIYTLVLAHRGSSSRGLDRFAPGRALARGCREAGIPFVDLLEPLRSVQEPTFNLIDQHWNAQGNRVGADAVFDLLNKLPSPRPTMAAAGR